MNRGRALSIMSELGVTAIVASTPENVCYLTGHVGWAQYVYRNLPCVAAFTADQPAGAANQPAGAADRTAGTDLVVPRSDTPYLAAVPSGAERTSAYGGRAGLLPGGEVLTDEAERFEALQECCARHAGPESAIVEQLRDRGLRAGRIVVDDPHAIPALMPALAAAFPEAEVVAGGGLFLMIRLVKTPEETDLLREASSVNERALQKALDLVAAGATERQVAAAWRAEAAGSGAVPLWFHLGGGPRSAYVFPPSDRRFQRGDLFIVDAGMLYRGFMADSGLCGSIGDPSAQASREWAAVSSAFDASVAALRAGVKGSEVYDALVGALRGSVLSDAHVPFAGHTIGLSAREFPFVLGPAIRVDQPFLPSTSDIPLPAGATVNVEVPLGRLGYGGYQIEKTFVLTEDGADELLDYDREMLVVA